MRDGKIASKPLNQPFRANKVTSGQMGYLAHQNISSVKVPEQPVKNIQRSPHNIQGLLSEEHRGKNSIKLIRKVVSPVQN